MLNFLHGIIHRFFNKKQLIVWVIGFVVIFLIKLLIKFIKKKISQKELNVIAQDKRREDTLDSIIKNSKESKTNIQNTSVPYEVDYSAKDMPKNTVDKKNGKNKKTMSIQLIEHNELSSRKHMFNLSQKISIGSAKEGNTIVVSDIAAHQCEIFEYQKNVYIREVAENNSTWIKRGKTVAYADRNGTKLNTGDVITVNHTSFEVKIL